MMKLPSLNGHQIVQVFSKLGWEEARQRGSHIIMTKEGHISSLSIPDHKEVAKGILRSLIRSAGITVDLFLDTMNK